MKKMMIRVLPVLLIVCMLFTACGQKECGHANTELRNAKPATCTAEGFTGDTVCKDCGAVITAGTVAPLADHTWGEWTVTKKPTPITTGTQTRTCTICAATEQGTIPAGGFNAGSFEGFTGTWGSIDLGEIDSYQELAETVFETLFDFQNGTMTFEFAADGNSAVVNVTVNAKGDSYVVLINAEATNEKGEKDGITIAYDNGVMVAYDENGGEFVDIDAMGEVSYSDVYLSLSKSFAELDEFAVLYLDSFKNAAELSPEIAELYNKLMSQLGETKTYDEVMSATVDTMQSLYVNLVGLLGFESKLEATVDVAAPSIQDMFKILSSITTVTEVDGGKVYTLDASNILNSVTATLDELKSYCDMTYGEFAYIVIAPFITNPEINDWAKLEAYIRANFTGDTKCSVYIDKMISSIEAQGVSVDDYYALMDACLEKVTGQEFNSKEALMEFYDVTLNELLTMMVGEEVTLEAFYGEIFPMLNEGVIGDIPVDEGTTISGAIDMIKAELAKVAINALGFSITTDAQGNVIGVLVETDVAYDSASVVDIKLEIKQDDSAKVVFPEAIAKGLATKINAVYDANGNLVISGLNKDLNYEFDVESYESVEFKIGDIVEKNTELTKEWGIDVYTIKKEYQKEYYVEGFVKVGEKYVNLYEVKDESGFEELQLPTMQLPSGQMMYVKGAENGYTYGYIALNDERCVWAAYNPHISEEIYCGEMSSLWLNLEDLYEASNYLTKNADGTYTISADLFKELDQYLGDDYGDSYCIGINVSYDVDGKDFYAWYEVGEKHGGEIPAFHEAFYGSATEGPSEISPIDWYEWFQK